MVPNWLWSEYNVPSSMLYLKDLNTHMYIPMSMHVQVFTTAIVQICKWLHAGNLSLPLGLLSTSGSNCCIDTSPSGHPTLYQYHWCLSFNSRALSDFTNHAHLQVSQTYWIGCNKWKYNASVDWLNHVSFSHLYLSNHVQLTCFPQPRPFQPEIETADDSNWVKLPIPI